MEVVFKIGSVYGSRPFPLAEVQPRFFPYPRLHRWIIFSFECKSIDYCLLLASGVTLG